MPGCPEHLLHTKDAATSGCHCTTSVICAAAVATGFTILLPTPHKAGAQGSCSSYATGKSTYQGIMYNSSQLGLFLCTRMLILSNLGIASFLR